MIHSLFFGSSFQQENLSPSRAKFYTAVVALVAGNLVFPMLCHAAGIGPVLLPIYFFTLLAAYRYGLIAGLTTAILSPLVNFFITGMPPLAILDVLIVKSVLLAVFASLVGQRSSRVSVMHLLGVLVGYQGLGGLYEAIRAGSIQAAAADWITGWPGLLLQLVGGVLILTFWNRRAR